MELGGWTPIFITIGVCILLITLLPIGFWIYFVFL
ncbi:MAG: hypothetical protein N4J56_007326 [Chroococcidiopsis sp. SAG 2025]|nr:hypothetical protein [Chroococcidiopsis sp. SAG 2025]